MSVVIRDAVWLHDVYATATLPPGTLTTFRLRPSWYTVTINRRLAAWGLGYPGSIQILWAGVGCAPSIIETWPIVSSDSVLQPDVYPLPIPGHGIAHAPCPAAVGLDPVDTLADQASLLDSAGFAASDPAIAARSLDPALWEELAGQHGRDIIRSGGYLWRVQAAAHSAYRSELVARCGTAVLARSLDLTTCDHTCSQSTSGVAPVTEFWLKRHGTWLMWWVQ